MFNKDEYIKSEPWNLDPSLVNPDTATKSCSYCFDIKFTVEFANVPEFTDGKLPICTQCLKSRSKGVSALDVIEDTQITRECRKCHLVKAISSFSHHKAGNVLHHTCKACIGTWWKR